MKIEKEINQIKKELNDHEKRIRIFEVLSSEKQERNISVAKVNIKNTPLQAEFNKNPRAFLKQYARGKNGPQKFVLVVAFLAEGKIGVNILFNEIEKIWNRHSGLLGGKLTSRTYGTRAKESGWIDSRKKGLYKLTDEWKGIF